MLCIGAYTMQITEFKWARTFPLKYIKVFIEGLVDSSLLHEKLA